MTVKIT